MIRSAVVAAVVDLGAVNSLTHGRAYVPYATRLSPSPADRHECVGPGDRADQRDRRGYQRRRPPGRHRRRHQTDTGFRREAVTDDTGSFTLPNLPTGPYRLEATLSGFRTYAQTGIVLQVNSNPVHPGDAAAWRARGNVTVESATPLVETRNPAVGQVINNEQIEALPLEGRNAASLDRADGRRGRHGQPLAAAA